MPGDLVLPVLLLPACSRPTVPVPDAAPAAAEGPPLAVLVVVDQLPVRLVDRVLPLATGGLRRIADHGYVAVGRHRHLATETCPGHAAVSTGAAPDRTGIVANAWWDGAAYRYCVSDAKDASLLAADALADRVTDAGGRAVALALKDRAAVMLGGHHPTATAWVDPKADSGLGGANLGALGALPPWRCTGTREWDVIDATHAEAYARDFPDAQAFEMDDAPTFPHVRRCEEPRGFWNSPDAGAWLVDAALAAVEHTGLGQGPGPDLLALSFSEIDVVGHTYTPDSWEANDALLRLDQDLERLFVALDARLGPDGYTVLLTADHGATPGDPHRLPEALADGAMAAAATASGAAAPEFSEPWVWLPAGLAPDARARAVAAVHGALDGQPGILAVVDLGDPAAPRPTDPKLATALTLGAYPGRSGDLAVLRADGWQWELRMGDHVENRGTTHGSTDDRDQRVPIWLWGVGVRPGRAGEDLDVRQVAPTAAALLGIASPRDAELGPISAAIAAAP